MDLYDKALRVCIMAHAGQFRHDGITPYHSHPIAVASLLPNYDEKIVALLHDVVEDTNWTIEDIEDMGFNDDIVVAVELLTHIKGESYQGYIECIMTSKLATRVKLADIMHNISDCPTDRQKVKYVKSFKMLMEVV